MSGSDKRTRIGPVKLTGSGQPAPDWMGQLLQAGLSTPKLPPDQLVRPHPPAATPQTAKSARPKAPRGHHVGGVLHPLGTMQPVNAHDREFRREPDAAIPPVRFDEGRSGPAGLTTTVSSTRPGPLRLLYSFPVFRVGLVAWRQMKSLSERGADRLYPKGYVHAQLYVELVLHNRIFALRQ